MMEKLEGGECTEETQDVRIIQIKFKQLSSMLGQHRNPLLRI